MYLLGSRHVCIVTTVKDVSSCYRRDTASLWVFFFFVIPWIQLKISPLDLRSLTHYNDRWWDYGKVLREGDNPIVGEPLLGDHVGRTQHGLCRHQDEAAQQEETLHPSLKRHHREKTRRSEWTVGVGSRPESSQRLIASMLPPQSISCHLTVTN